MTIAELTTEAIEFLKTLIQTQSFSKEEQLTAVLIEDWFNKKGIPFHRHGNNIWAYNKFFDQDKPTVLLNSHHDTVKPNKNYTRDPFEAKVEGDQLFGLGSNDAGGCLVSLMATFAYFYEQADMAYNFIIAPTAEEEISGLNGIKSIVDQFKNVEFAIVGEPTLLDLAIAEKGLLVLDISIKGTAGHAAHRYEDQPVFNALPVLEWFKNYEFPKVSEQLGKVKMTVTQINAGSQHNVVPGELNLVVDCRVTDQYQNKEIFEIINEAIGSDKVVVKARSFRLNSSSISPEHPVVKAGIAMGKNTYGSPTLSDQTNLTCPSLKMGPGDSTRSHSADEFIYISEIKEGIKTYIELLEKIL
ncbi:M20 family metallo-hydrolase [Aquimarina agarilytica]|uniref:M20 family metallo-hydrolase n=1 Tax=Aquimarina agarilytica TaxID=1087449 RepID=UPI00028A2D51|nr:M20 family metallo-hydrolase [Aquimarina agarilytica]